MVGSHLGKLDILGLFAANSDCVDRQILTLQKIGGLQWIGITIICTVREKHNPCNQPLIAKFGYKIQAPAQIRCRTLCSQVVAIFYVLNLRSKFVGLNFEVLLELGQQPRICAITQERSGKPRARPFVAGVFNGHAPGIIHQDQERTLARNDRGDRNHRFEERKQKQSDHQKF